MKALNMTSFTGNFTNKLTTSCEPYSWTMYLERTFDEGQREAVRERLQKYAYVLLAEIGNLDSVIYEYTVGGETITLQVNAEEASEYAGTDIKAVGEDINLLEMLIEKTQLATLSIND